MTKLPNNKGPSWDKSEHSRNIVEKARDRQEISSRGQLAGCEGNSP
jgi:hypothetical protein